MPNYRTHTTINLFFALPFFLGIALLLALPEAHYLWTFGICFIYGTCFMNPDVDLANQIKLFSWRGLFSIPFRSYTLFFRHRGLSHSFLFGTITRLVWLLMYVMAFLYLFYHITPTPQLFLDYVKSFQNDLIFGFAGFFIADATHILVDKLS